MAMDVSTANTITLMQDDINKLSTERDVLRTKLQLAEDVVFIEREKVAKQKDDIEFLKECIDTAIKDRDYFAKQRDEFKEKLRLQELSVEMTANDLKGRLLTAELHGDALQKQVDDLKQELCESRMAEVSAAVDFDELKKRIDQGSRDQLSNVSTTFVAGVTAILLAKGMTVTAQQYEFWWAGVFALGVCFWTCGMWLWPNYEDEDRPHR